MEGGVTDFENVKLSFAQLNKIVSKLFWNYSVSVSFCCGDSITVRFL